MITTGSGGKRIDRPSEIDTSVSVPTGRNYSDIIKGLETIKEKYDTSRKEKAKASVSSVSEKTFDTDEDLLSRATSELDTKYGPKRTKAEETYGDTLIDAEKKKSTLATSYADALRLIREKEESTLASQAERAARRGVTHSSIAELQAEKTRTEADRDVQITDAYYAQRVEDLDEKIRRAKRSYDDAMSGYEIAYAIELEKKMEKYRAQRDKLLAQYEKSVNKDEEKKVTEYLREEDARQTAFEAANGDYEGAKKDNYLERYAYVVKEMQGMSESERKGFLTVYENSLREYLGLYYDRLLGK